MRNLRKRVLTIMASILAVASVSFTMVSLTAPGVASARCAGGAEIRSTLIVNGVEFVAERPDSGTCNFDGRYHGHFAAKEPGWRASVWIQNSGSWDGTFGTRSLANKDYDYPDANSNSWMVLCADSGVRVYCGYGDNVIPAEYPHFPYREAPHLINSGY
jgi:hypothetical protein